MLLFILLFGFIFCEIVWIGEGGNINNMKVLIEIRQRTNKGFSYFIAGTLILVAFLAIALHFNSCVSAKPAQQYKAAVIDTSFEEKAAEILASHDSTE